MRTPWLRTVLGWGVDRGAEGVYQDALLSGSAWRWITRAFAFLGIGGGSMTTALHEMRFSWTLAISLGVLFAVCLIYGVTLVNLMVTGRQITQIAGTSAKPREEQSKDQLESKSTARPVMAIIIPIAMMVLLFVLIIIGRPPSIDPSQSKPISSNSETGQLAIYNGFDYIQKRILRTMIEHQNKIEDGQRWYFPLVRNLPADPQYALPEFVEFMEHITPLASSGYITCAYEDGKARPYCALTDVGILLMRSIGPLSGAPPYILPRVSTTND